MLRTPCARCGRAGAFCVLYSRDGNSPMKVFVMLLCSGLLVLGCKSRGPAPGDALTEREDVIMAEREGSPSGIQRLGIPKKEYKRDYRSIPHDPHGPAANLNPPPSHVSGEIKHIDVGGLTFQAPEGWEYRHPASAMRRAELGVRAEDGTAGLVVYFFGNRGAGSAQANIDRWVGQFKNPDGSGLAHVKPIKRKIAGLEVLQVEVAGTYVGGMGSGTPGEGQPGQRMIATIVKTPRGPFYFKFLGADAVVQSQRRALGSLLTSMKLSDG